MRKNETAYRRTLSQRFESTFLDFRFGGCLLDDEKHSTLFEKGCYHTQSIEYEELKQIFSDIELFPSDVVLDVGCGRGRLFNYLLCKKFTGRIIGVEIDAEIASFTKIRLRRYTNIEIYCANALDFVFPEVTIYFLFCPFDINWTKGFVAMIEKFHTDVRIIYYYPKYIGCMLPREGWTGERRIINSEIRGFNLPCQYLQYTKPKAK